MIQYNLDPNTRDIPNSCKVFSITPIKSLKDNTLKKTMKKIKSWACTPLLRRERRSIWIKLKKMKTSNSLLEGSMRSIISNGSMRQTNKLTSLKKKCKMLRQRKLRENIKILSRPSIIRNYTKESMCKQSRFILMSSTRESRPTRKPSKMNPKKTMKQRINRTKVNKLKEFFLRV